MLVRRGVPVWFDGLYPGGSVWTRGSLWPRRRAKRPIMGAQEPSLVAAIDLGSNSFHMIVGRLEDGTQLHIVDKVRERVQLGAGLDAKRRLSIEAQTRALDCLARFGERIRSLGEGQVRAVGTNTLRQARNGKQFLRHARKMLGHPIEVIAGREEARLIYLGVLQSLADDVGQRLVVDIGGGSTEFVVGRKSDMLLADSLFMGCVSFSRKFFAEGRLLKERFSMAELAAHVELDSLGNAYRKLGWDEAVGCSGTVHALKRIAQANGWGTDFLTLDALRRAKEALVRAGRLERVDLAGLQEDRRPVIAGGLSILTAVFESLRIERMRPSPGALREGVLYDLVGRIRHEDVRDRTIRGLCERYGVDMAQAKRVERTALDLLGQVAQAWGLENKEAQRMLSWAAHLHEIGLSIAHTGYHRHGAYIVANADMAGFSRNDQQILSAVIRSQRRKLKPSYFWELPPDHHGFGIKLAALFRLARVLNRSRVDRFPRMRFDVHETRKGRSRLTFRFHAGWLAAHPLTRTDLENNARDLRKVGVKVRVKTDDAPREPADSGM